MILFDEEVYLVLKLRHITLISLMLILLSQLVHVLATLVQLAQSHDFIVSDLDLLIQAPGFLFLLQVLLHEFIILLPQLVSSLICSAQFCRPLLIFDIHTTVTSRYLRLLHAFIALAVIVATIARTLIRQVLAQLEALSGATEHVVQFTIRIKSTNDLILRRHIELLHDFVQFLAQFDIFGVKLGYLAVLV